MRCFRQGRSVTDIWGREKPEVIRNKNLKVGGGHGQKFLILMVKIKEISSWRGHVPNVFPQPTGMFGDI